MASPYGSCCPSSYLLSLTPACLQQTRGEMSSSVLYAAGSGCTGIALLYLRTTTTPADIDRLPDPSRLQGLCYLPACHSSGPLILPLSGHWKELCSSCQVYFVSRMTPIYVYILVGYGHSLEMISQAGLRPVLTIC